MDSSAIDDDFGANSLLQHANDLRDPTKREDAAAQLWNLLHERLEARLAVRIADQLQGKVSAESAVLAALATFCRRRAAGEYDFQDSSDVDALMYTIARNKLIDSIRRFTAKKRNPQAAGGDNAKDDLSSGSGGSSLFDAEPAERNNVASGALEAGHGVACYPERVQRENNKRFDPPPEMGEMDADSATDWLGEMLAGEEPYVAAFVKEKLEMLDDDLKEVLRLRFVEGYALQDLPNKMNRTLKQVRLKIAAIQEAFLDLYDDSQFGMHAPKPHPKRSP